jgi:hypothetical protein
LAQQLRVTGYCFFETTLHVWRCFKQGKFAI